MSTIYLTTTFGKLSKKGETLQLTLEDGAVKTIFPFKTEQLVLIGNIDISTPALKFLMHRQINTIFLNKNGRFNGRLSFKSGKNVFLRQKQFERLKDEAFKLSFAKAVAKGKMSNQLGFMQRIIRKQSTDKSFKEQLRNIKSAIQKCDDANSLSSLRGYEGSGARAFFAVYRHAIVQDWAVFNGRNMNPPKDNVNAVLSFLYTMILSRVDAALEMEGLDPHVGYFHRIDYGKRSLAFDLMEEFRTPIADTLTAALFNLGVLNKDDFRKEMFSSENDDFPLEDNPDHEAFDEIKGVLLSKEGLKKTIVQFEKKLETELFYSFLGRRITYKQIIVQQIKHFKRVLNGEERVYKPLTLK